jgi:hypothetical protein
MLLGACAANSWELKLGTNLPPVDIHGFASQGFLYSTDKNFLGDSTSGSFRFTEAGLNIAFNPFPRTRVAAQAFLFDVGGYGEYQPFLDFASIEYTFNEHLGFRLGRVRKSAGIYNHIQDVDLARTWVLLPQGMYDARWRDFSTSIDGAVVFGNIPMSDAGGLSYEVAGGVAHISKDGGVGGIINNGMWEAAQLNPMVPLLSVDSIETLPLVAAQLWWNTPVNGLRLGSFFSYVFNFEYDFSGETLMGGLRGNSESHVVLQQYSAEYVWKSLTLQAEYQNLAIFGEQTTGGMTQNGNNRSDTWYVSAAYRFNKYFEAGMYYNEYYASTKNRSGNPDAAQKDWAFLSLRFDPTDWLILKAEGHYIRGTALLHDARRNPSRDNDGWFMLATKATVSF